MEYIDYDKMVSVFNECSLLSKEDILRDIDYKLMKIRKGSGLDIRHSAAFYSRLQELLLKFRNKVEDAILFEELEELWAYGVDVNDTGVSLSLYHVSSVDYDDEDIVTCEVIDENFELIKVNARLLTVEKYAEIYGVTVGAVRQWIRRGKLRSAIKTGGEWRIPELAEVSGRGYKYGTYSWQDELSDIPQEYGFLNDYSYVSISQDDEKKDLFHIKLRKIEDGITINSYDIDMESKEKEKFELVLISNPLIKAPTEFKNIFPVDRVNL